MRIGILEAGGPPADIKSAVGSYPAMIRAALGSVYAYREFDVTGGDLPGQSAADAYIITGSASSVYESQPWILRLCDWLKRVDPATPLVGLCFGHQIMAQAYGGVVKRSERGLAVGLHEYQVTHREIWMDEIKGFVLPVSHHDQIVEAPPASRVIATSEFCPNAALFYSDRRALSFQAHPEFTVDFAEMVIDRWQQRGALTDEQTEKARASLLLSDDSSRVNEWIRRFLEGRPYSLSSTGGY